jgi:hypothetical protein
MREQTIDLSHVRVMLGMPVNANIPPQTVLSLIDTINFFNEKSILHSLRFVLGCSIVEQARSIVCHNFLRSNATHLFMLDSDMVWAREDAMTLVALATRLHCVGAIYPVKKDPPTWFVSAPEAMTMNEYNCLPVKGMGLGCTVIQRNIVELLAEKAPKLRFIGYDEPVAHLFHTSQEDGDFVGEDIAFFKDVCKLGYQPWLCPRIDVGHVGQKEYRASFMAAIADRRVKAVREEAVHE